MVTTLTKMMSDEKSKKLTPPYVSYRSFSNFIEGLVPTIPARIDRAFWEDKLSGTTGTQVMAALRFFNLIDEDGAPTAKLRALAPAKGSQRATLLRQLANESYAGFFQSKTDPAEATYSILEEYFKTNYQLNTEVLRKCIKFFVSLAQAAEIPLSQYITKKTQPRQTKTITNTTMKKNTKTDLIQTEQNLLIPKLPDKIPENGSWGNMVLSKFPDLDPAWSPELKIKWFECFSVLLGMQPTSRNEK